MNYQCICTSVIVPHELQEMNNFLLNDTKTVKGASHKKEKKRKKNSCLRALFFYFEVQEKVYHLNKPTGIFSYQVDWCSLM